MAPPVVPPESRPDRTELGPGSLLEGWLHAASRTASMVGGANWILGMHRR